MLTLLATSDPATLFNHVIGLISAGGLLTSLVMFGFPVWFTWIFI